LHCIQNTCLVKNDDTPSRFLYVELGLSGVAGVSDEAKALLREAIAATKRLIPTFQHSKLGVGKDLIANADFDDAVRLVLLILEEMERCPMSKS